MLCAHAKKEKGKLEMSLKDELNRRAEPVQNFQARERERLEREKEAYLQEQSRLYDLQEIEKRQALLTGIPAMCREAADRGESRLDIYELTICDYDLPKPSFMRSICDMMQPAHLRSRATIHDVCPWHLKGFGLLVYQEIKRLDLLVSITSRRTYRGESLWLTAIW